MIKRLLQPYGNSEFVRKGTMNISSVSPKTRELADSLVEFEKAATIQNEDVHATCRVCEKLRHPLVTLTGTAGYSSLLSRALTLAKREALALSEVQVRPDGSLEGLKSETAQAHPVLVAYLLSLLITFIGEDLTMKLVQDIWPEFTGSDQISSGRNRNESAQ
jgi:hypothetical protein